MRFLESFLNDIYTPEVPTKPTQPSLIPEIPTLEEPSKPTQPGFEGFVGTGTLVYDAKEDAVWSDPNVIATYEAGGEIVAALLFAAVLKSYIWLAFDDDFKPNDKRAVFYGHELQYLKTKTSAELREIHKVKLAFTPGSRVRQ
jgi:hypothetical protein